MAKNDTTPPAGYPSRADLDRLRGALIADLEARLQELKGLTQVATAEPAPVAEPIDAVEVAAVDAGELALSDIIHRRDGAPPRSPARLLWLIRQTLREVWAIQRAITKGQLRNDYDLDADVTGMEWVLRFASDALESGLDPAELLALGPWDPWGDDENEVVEVDEAVSVEVPLTGSPGQCPDGPQIRALAFALFDAQAACLGLRDEHGESCSCYGCTVAEHGPYLLGNLIADLEGSIITVDCLRRVWETARGKAAVTTKRPPQPRVAVEA